MREEILRRLKKIEANENVKILLAVESGSRAWGFASEDSDYDVRFIYIRRTQDYLRLDSLRDVIEEPLDAVLDINGWDLQKALRLLYRSNPTLFEWFSSPIVYMETEFVSRFRELMQDYFSDKKTIYHYLNMAERNYHAYIKSNTSELAMDASISDKEKDLLKVKKYFYTLRPILACKWILDRHTAPPMLFSELMEAELPKDLYEAVEHLLDLKIHARELEKIPRVVAIDAYIEQSISDIKSIVKSMDDRKVSDWRELNRMFLGELRNASTLK